jgi:hypothetical protein
MKRFSLPAFLTFVILVLSIPLVYPYDALPWQPWGMDLGNLWGYHHCAIRNHPYAAGWRAFGCEPGHRPVVYPPLLYWSFAWLRLFDLVTAVRIWTGAILAGVFASTLAWMDGEPQPLARHWPKLLFAGLLLVQYPVMFGTLRGSNDVVVLVLWSIAFVLAARGRWAWAGALCGLATAIKLYPLIPTVLVGLDLLLTNRRRFVRFTGGVVAAGALSVALFARDTLEYLPILKQWSGERLLPAIYGHALLAIVNVPHVGRVLTLLLLFGWMAAIFLRRHEPDVPMLFAGTVAISTYFAGTSYDYNLITAYPLMVVLFNRAQAGRHSAWLPLLLLIVSMLGSRYLFLNRVAAHIVLQVLALLVAAGWWIAMRERPSAVPSHIGQ